jgi:hypothetical protein
MFTDHDVNVMQKNNLVKLFVCCMMEGKEVKREREERGENPSHTPPNPTTSKTRPAKNPSINTQVKQ